EGTQGMAQGYRTCGSRWIRGGCREAVLRARRHAGLARPVPDAGCTASALRVRSSERSGDLRAAVPAALLRAEQVVEPLAGGLHVFREARWQQLVAGRLRIQAQREVDDGPAAAIDEGGGYVRFAAFFRRLAVQRKGQALRPCQLAQHTASLVCSGPA